VPATANIILQLILQLTLYVIQRMVAAGVINGAEEAVEVAKGMPVAPKGMAVPWVDKNTEVSNAYLTAPLLLAHAAHGQSLL